jgi:hypothetical protein
LDGDPSDPLVGAIADPLLRTALVAEGSELSNLPEFNLRVTEIIGHSLDLAASANG